ncbi:MAG: imidazole glycerol phosphate synthase subunit HisF, partial [Bacteroidia bacterium]|nr:imidazole glycerol phosphate synthase subunit HisF [Bacteroidia bacterium]
MFRPRVIPCLLLRNLGLVKSIKFKDYTYVGDPMNAVKIFNDKQADELIFLDITATKEKREVSLELIENIGDECNMPFAVGGGIRSIKNIKEILNAGAEKVCINSFAVENPQFIQEAANEFGSSTIVASIDVKKKFMGSKQVYTQGGSKSTGLDPVKHAVHLAELGVGEILINSIE